MTTSPLLTLDHVSFVLPDGSTLFSDLDEVFDARHTGLVGRNGVGKTVLGRLLAGELVPTRGRCLRQGRVVRLAQQVADPPGGTVADLDQHLAQLDPAQPVLAQLLAVQPRGDEGRLRMQLAQLGLDADRVARPSGRLSGGERLKAALACALYADPPAQLLLLDEPGNHLDLPSLQALEAVLRAYPGALVVASHDDSFLAQLGLTDRLAATAQGWRLDPWPIDGGPLCS